MDTYKPNATEKGSHRQRKVLCTSCPYVFDDESKVRSSMSNCYIIPFFPQSNLFHIMGYFVVRLIGQLRRVIIQGNKIITLLSCPISLAIGFLFYSMLLILIYTKIRLHLATVCPSGPCIELPISLLPESERNSIKSRKTFSSATNMPCHGRENTASLMRIPCKINFISFEFLKSS